jgi:multiple sugar transport system ATP-binding protein
VLEAGEVRQIGRPLELYHLPKNQFVAGFIGSPKMNFLPATITAVSAQGLSVASPDIGSQLIPVMPGTAQVGESVTLGIRPEHITAGTGRSIQMRGQVGLVERLGHETFVELSTAAGQLLTATIDGVALVEVSQNLALSFDAHDCHLFSAAGDAYTRMQVPAIAQQGQLAA